MMLECKCSQNIMISEYIHIVDGNQESLHAYTLGILHMYNHD